MERRPFLFFRKYILSVATIASQVFTAFFLHSSPTEASTTSGITYHGRIIKPDGTPLEGIVQFKLQIRTPGNQNCLLFEELQTLDMRNSNGIFSLTINGINRGNDEYAPGKRYSLERVFQNRGEFTGLPDCILGSGSYKPNETDGRRFVVYFREESMSAWEPMPETIINFVPLAFEARSLGGFNINNVLRVEDNGEPGNAPALSPSDITELRHLLDGSSSQYLTRSNDAGATLPSFSGGNPSAPLPGSIWYDSDNKVIKFYDGTTAITLGTGSGSGSVTSITAGAGLTGGTITTSGTIALEDVGTPGTYVKVTTDQKGRVTSGAVKLDETDLPDTIVTPGRVSGDAITSGTITGSTSINTTGSITSATMATKVLDLYDSDSTNRIRFQTPATAELTTDYALTWPATPGSPGQVLTTDGSGVLSWMSVGGGTITSVSAAAPLSSSGGTTPQISISKADGSTDGYLSATDWNLFNQKLSSNLATGNILVGNAANVATAVAPSGDLSLDSSGVFTVEKIQGKEVDPSDPTDAGQVLRWDGSKYAPTYLSLADIRSTMPPYNTIFPSTSCSADETLTWSSLTDTFSCQTISIASTQVTGLGDAATKNVGTTAGTVAAGDDSRIVNAVQRTGDTMTGTLNLPANGLVVGTDQLVVSGGNVGIGTTNPNYKLEVSGHAQIGPIYFYNNEINTYNGGMIVVGARRMADLATNTGRAEFRVMNRIGVNVDPSVPLDGYLHVIGGATASVNDAIVIGSAGNGGTGRGQAILIRQPSGDGVGRDAVRLAGVDSGITISTGPNGNLTEQVRVDSSGRVGIGTITPSAKLEIKSSLATEATGLYIDRSAGAANGALTDIKGIYIDQTSANDSTSNIGVDVSVRHNLAAGGTVAVKGKVDNVIYPDYGPAIGVYGIAHHGDTNGLGTAIGVKGEVTASGTGSFAKTYAGYFDNTATSGAENVGIYVKTTNAGTYGIYQDGGADNYFSGNVGIGVQNPTEKLSVDGVIESKSGGIKFPDGTVQTTAASGGSSGTYMTPQSTTSGNVINFSGIPTSVTTVEILFDTVSISGSGHILIQIGDSGGIETTGYTSSSSGVSDGAGVETSTSGFIVRGAGSSRAFSGVLTLRRFTPTGNLWVISGTVGTASDAITVLVGGRKTLSGNLDRVRITTTAGNFDSGQINIVYK